MLVSCVMMSSVLDCGQMDEMINEKLAKQEAKWKAKLNALQKEHERQMIEVRCSELTHAVVKQDLVNNCHSWYYTD